MSRARVGLTAIAFLAACGGAQTRFPLFSTNWEDDGGASIESGLMAGLRISAPCLISFSFAGWSSGTKLSSDMVRRSENVIAVAVFLPSASVNGAGPMMSTSRAYALRKFA